MDYYTIWGGVATILLASCNVNRGQSSGVVCLWVFQLSLPVMIFQEAFREAMNAHSAQLTKMRLPERTVVLKAVTKAKNPILMKRKNMFNLR